MPAAPRHPRSKRKDKSSRLFSTLFALLLIIFGALIILFTFLPVFRAEVNYKIQPLPIVTPTPIDFSFSIQIPKININTKVIKNVDPLDSKKYQLALTKGVAHALGSATPDQPGNVFIFAHSAQDWYQANQYNAIFYLITKLAKNDEITLFYQGRPYVYSVSKISRVDSNAIEYLKGDKADNTVQLMTCWPPGTTLQRLVVTATKKG